MNKIKIVKYEADWCGPCKNLTATLNSFKNEGVWKSVDFVSKNVDEEDVRNELASLNIKAIPHTVIYKDEEIVKEATGIFTEADLSAWMIEVFGSSWDTQTK